MRRLADGRKYGSDTPRRWFKHQGVFEPIASEIIVRQC